LRTWWVGFILPFTHTGVDLGTGCNRLHLKGPMILRPMMTMPRSYSTSGQSEYRQEFIPWVAAMANLKITSQGAWTDSVTNRFSLTQAREMTLPAGLPKPAPKRMHTYQYSSSTATTGRGPYNNYYYNPAMAYTTK